MVISKQKSYEQKTYLSESEQARETGTGTSEDRVDPAQQVGHDRQPNRDSPQTC